LRLGALLAADVAAVDPDRIVCLVFWQPVLSGDRYLTQFLRLRIAATMDRGPDREATKDLRGRLSQGEALEIAGYELAPALAESIASLQLQGHVNRLGRLPISWLEVASDEQPALTPSSLQIAGMLEQQGHPLLAKSVSGEPFWAVQEITLAPNLLQATDDLFRS
jgi:exosortase A-associated hydrolase 2